MANEYFANEVDHKGRTSYRRLALGLRFPPPPSPNPGPLSQVFTRLDTIPPSEQGTTRLQQFRRSEVVFLSTSLSNTHKITSATYQGPSTEDRRNRKRKDKTKKRPSNTCLRNTRLSPFPTKPLPPLLASLILVSTTTNTTRQKRHNPSHHTQGRAGNTFFSTSTYPVIPAPMKSHCIIISPHLLNNKTTKKHAC